MAKVHTVLGLMSGTSMDGIDAALLRTDGIEAGKRLGTHFLPYSDEDKATIRSVLGFSIDFDGRVAQVEQLVTDLHIKMVNEFRKLHPNEKIDLIGFHGQTIFHDPLLHKRTWQLGDGPKMAQETGIDVMYDFRSNDMKNGGQGAPLIPLYHQAMIRAARLDEPACILNLGGVGNLTWVKDDAVFACDTGPGNALLDDWMLKKTGTPYDKDGAYALRGSVDRNRVKRWMDHPFFRAHAPKSLDRNAFEHCTVDDMSIEDGAATLTAFTVASIVIALEKMPYGTHQIIVSGGGRKNTAIMQGLGSHMAVINADQLGWAGDFIEAEGFAYLAARSLAGLPTSLPTTTGCKKPTIGGRFVRAKKAASAT